MSAQLTQVVLTRPVGQNDALKASLQEKAIQCIELPMLEIVSLDDGPAEQVALAQLSKLAGYDFALFVSANAVRQAARLCQKHRLAWPKTLSCIGMGLSTEQAMRDMGCAVLPQPSKNDASLSSEEMMQQPWSTQVAKKRVAVLKGEGGRQYMQQVLAERGASVSELVLYRRAAPRYATPFILQTLQAIIQSPQSSAIVLASADTLANWADMLEQADLSSLKTSINLLVPSERVARAAKERGFVSVSVTHGASNTAFLSALINR